MASLKLEYRPMDLPLLRPFTTSRDSRKIARNVLVEIHCEGIIGRGEAAPSPRYGQSQESALEALREFRIREDLHPMQQQEILDSFQRDHPGEIAASCGIETALWDWAGKKTRQPLGRLLGIDPRRVPSSSFTVSIDDPQASRQRIAEAADWPVLKIKMGGGPEDIMRIEQLVQLTDRPFRVDANEAWDEIEAAEKIPWLAEMGCELVEQPLPAGNLDAMRRLKESSPIPLIADEDCDQAERIEALAGAYHGINVKLMKCGGIRSAVHWIHAARRSGLECMIGCFVESGVAIAAAAHLSPLCRWADLDGAALLAENPYEGTRVESGRILISTGAGLGIEPTRPDR